MEALRNQAGQTLEEFLDSYDPRKWEQPCVTVDMAVVTEEREILLIRRGNHPNIGAWALPAVFWRWMRPSMRGLQGSSGRRPDCAASF